MKILFISRATFFKDNGGDTVQALNTAKYLEKLGVEISIRLCNEEIDYSAFDILHFFNIIRPADILRHIKKSGKPFVISTIYVDYSEYEKNARHGLAASILRIFPRHFIEYLKVIARAIVNGEKIVSPVYLLLGQARAVRRIIKQSFRLLPNSENEYLRLSRDFNIRHNYSVIPNAVDTVLFRRNQSPETRQNNLVICAARIEGRKNQLNLILALNNSEFDLILIGRPSANQAKYYELCRQTAAPNISFINNIPQEDLLTYYERAKVHALPSWFETTGLSSLEAAAMGCNIVITDKGDTREYFADYAYYCDPASPASILAAVRQASKAPYDENLRDRIFENYIWEEAAEKTYEVYKEIRG